MGMTCQWQPSGGHQTGCPPFPFCNLQWRFAWKPPFRVRWDHVRECGRRTTLTAWTLQIQIPLNIGLLVQNHGATSHFYESSSALLPFFWGATAKSWYPDSSLSAGGPRSSLRVRVSRRGPRERTLRQPCQGARRESRVAFAHGVSF